MSGDKSKVEACFDGYDHIVKMTRNGYQWQCISCDTLEQVEAVAVAALNYVVAARKQPTTGQAQSTKKRSHVMGEEIVLEKIECLSQSYMFDLRGLESGRLERFFVMRDALFALLTVAERDKIESAPKEE